MSVCYTSYRKQELLETARFLLNQKCCDEIECSELANDLQDLQFKCNDVFGKINESNVDAKGNIPDSVCSMLRDKKIVISSRFRGGKKKRKQTQKKKRKRKTKRLRKNTKKSKRVKKINQ